MQCDPRSNADGRTVGSSGSPTPATGRQLEATGRLAPRLMFSGAALSSRGPRPDNQDSGLASPELVAVADGVGGNVGGAAASALAITSLVEQLPLPCDGDPEAQLRRAVSRANRRLGRLRSEVPVLAGMATTLTAMALSGAGHLVVAHIGDSRAYLLRGGQLVALTRDHSVVQAMLDASSISTEQARNHPWRSVLIAALQGREDDTVNVATSTLRALPGDRVLLCSDGLWGDTSWRRTRRALTQEYTASAAAVRLMESVQTAPARDNITVIVADVTTAEAAEKGRPWSWVLPPSRTSARSAPPSRRGGADQTLAKRRAL
ncbi:PP2C family protein-serine/threonine phosphatase [Modestobacter marinus]